MRNAPVFPKFYLIARARRQFCVGSFVWLPAPTAAAAAAAAAPD
eukprot:COSAG01_NODE_10245_length_2211_cov_2.952178_5_plen_43_part_01